MLVRNPSKLLRTLITAALAAVGLSGCGGSSHHNAGAPAAIAIVSGDGQTAVAGAALNDTATADLVVASFGSDDLTILLNRTSNATFTPAPGSPVAVGRQPTSVALGAIAGGPVVGVSNFGDDTATIVLLSATTGAVVSKAAAPAGKHPISIAFGPQLKPSGAPFFAVANAGDSTISVLTLNPATGAVATTTMVPLRMTPIAIAIDDLDGDGNADIAVVGADGSVLVLSGVGDGTFVEETGLFVEIAPRSSSRPFAIATGDIDPGSSFDTAPNNNPLGTVTNAATVNPDLAVADFGSNEPLLFLNFVSKSAGFLA